MRDAPRRVLSAIALRTPSTRRAAASLLGALALVGAVPRLSEAGPVKGRVTGIVRLVNPVWNEAKEASANRYTWREPSPTVRAEFRALYPLSTKEICVAAITSAPVQAGTQPIAFRIGGGRTSPVTLVVAPGTVLEFQNRDPFPHKPYIVNNPSFQAAEMRGASNRTWKVPGPGKYEVRDELAPSVRSWIVADANVQAIAYPGRDGAFAFGHLPPGDYTLKAFFNGEPTGKPLPFTLKNDSSYEIKDPLALVADEVAPVPAGKKTP